MSTTYDTLLGEGLETEIGDPSAGVPVDELADRLPNRIEVSDEPGRLVIQEEWFQWSHALVLAAVMATACGAIAAGNNLELPSTEIMAGVCGLLMLATYWALAGLANSTTITVTEDRVERTVGPFPWWGSVEADAMDIDQLYVVRVTRSRKRTSLWDWEGDRTTDRKGDFSLRKYKKVSFYKLVLRLNDSQVHTMSGEYNLPYTPRILEYLVEARMSITDRFVAAEVRQL